jgi:hypothetical protein
LMPTSGGTKQQPATVNQAAAGIIGYAQTSKNGGLTGRFEGDVRMTLTFPQ